MPSNPPAVDRRRRRIVVGAALAPLAALARGQAAPLAAPVVDRLSVRVLVDSVYDSPRAGDAKGVLVRRSGFVSPADPSRTLHSEWGLSLALESRLAGASRHVLLDFGYTPSALANNLEVLGIDPASFGALVASHGHLDHFGGLAGFLDRHRARMPDDLPLYVGGEETFCRRRIAIGGTGIVADWGALDRRALERHRIRIVHAARPEVVLGHGFTTGLIERGGFERVLPNALIEYFPSGGLGCDLPAENAKAGGRAVPDEQRHEHGLCFHVRGRGLVVISACGHAGIVNTVRHAMRVSGVRKLHAVMGGFHLFPAPEETVLTTVEALAQLEPDIVVPMHCSGPSVSILLRSELGERVVASATGTEFVFGA